MVDLRGWVGVFVVGDVVVDVAVDAVVDELYVPASDSGVCYEQSLADCFGEREDLRTSYFGDEAGSWWEMADSNFEREVVDVNSLEKGT